MSQQSMHAKPFSQSSEENKHVIQQAIQSFLNERSTVLEIGSGTGQHAVHFAEQMPHLSWQTSDLIESHNGIKQWISDANLNNVLPPLHLNVSENNWPTISYDVIFSANSFHIMGKENVQDFFENVNGVLNQTGVVMIYGPFNYDGQYTSESNARFDIWLKQRNPASCIKDFEWCNQLAEMAGLKLLNDIEMPQNNRILVWHKQG